jgi:hypothetical protein
VDSILESIQNNCAEKAKDNYSCYLLQMGEKMQELATPTVLIAENKPEIASENVVLIEEEEPETIIMQSPKIQAQTVSPVSVEPLAVKPVSPIHALLQQEVSNKPEWIRTSLDNVLPVYSAENEVVKPDENSGMPAWAWLCLFVLAIGGGWAIYNFGLKEQNVTNKYYQYYAQTEENFIKGDFKEALVSADSALKHATKQAQVDSMNILIHQISDKSVVSKEVNDPNKVISQPKTVVTTDNQSTVTPATPATISDPTKTESLSRGADADAEAKKKAAEAEKEAEASRKPDAGLADAKAKYKEAVKSANPEDYQEAIGKLIKAGNNMDGEAAYLLSYMYSRGLGGKTDHDNALKYAEMSSKKGWGAGSYYYGHLLLLKKSKNDTVSAKTVLKLAASKGNADAKERLSRLGVK